MRSNESIVEGAWPMRCFAIMNLALRGIEADFGPENADTFRCDLRAGSGTRVSAKPQPRNYLAGRLRSERQLVANQSCEGDILKVLTAADLADCMVALPSQLLGSSLEHPRWN